MSISDVAIANLALQKLGEGRIEALSQDHPFAREMNGAYERVRRAELRRYAWSFAIKRASIAAEGVEIVWGDWNRYSVPNDFLRLLRDDETGQRVDWRIEGLHIVTQDSAPLLIRYIADITDPNYYDELFVDAFASKLALQTCFRITGSTGKKNSIADEYNFSISEAKRIGSIEKEAQEFPEDEWVNARL